MDPLSWGIEGLHEFQTLSHAADVLIRQRERALCDVNSLSSIKENAMREPLAFLAKMQQGMVDLPRPQTVVVVPRVSFAQFRSISSAVLSDDASTKEVKEEPIDGMKTSPSALVSAASDHHPLDNPHVRGRKRDASKPQSFNQLWSEEEQKKLVDLLAVFPSEEVSARRWQKIAHAMGTRTARQVASRVQKYFIKLAQQGEPIPDKKTPNLEYYDKERMRRLKRQRRRKTRDRGRDTSEDERIKAQSGHSSGNDEMEMQESRRPVNRNNWDAKYKELLRLKRLKQARDKERVVKGTTDSIHYGYKCDGCAVEPIVGTRWSCTVCPDNVQVDLCTLCHQLNVFENEVHTRNHTFREVLVAEDPYRDEAYAFD